MVAQRIRRHVLATYPTTVPVAREEAEAVRSAIIAELAKAGAHFGPASFGFSDGSVLVVFLVPRQGLYKIAVRSYACGGVSARE